MAVLTNGWMGAGIATATTTATWVGKHQNTKDTILRRCISFNYDLIRLSYEVCGPQLLYIFCYTAPT